MKETTKISLIFLTALIALFLAVNFKEAFEKNDLLFWGICTLMAFLALVLVFPEIKKLWRRQG